MKHIKNKSIKFGLKILTISAFFLVFVPFNRAYAFYSSQCTSSDWGYTCEVGGDGNLNNNNDSPVYQAPIYTPPVVTTTPIVYSTATNPNPATPTTVVIHKKTSPIVTTKSTTNQNSGNGLAANAVYGSNSFLPSGLIQWILFAIFVLLIVILGRIVFGSKKKYQEAPLKHD